MKNLLVQTIAGMFFIFFLAACGGNSASKEQEAAEETATETATGIGGLVDAAKSMEKAAQEMQENGGTAVEPVDFRELKALLPASVNGMALSNPSGEKVGMMGFKVSTAEGEYKSNGSSVQLKIIDMGGMSSAVSMMAAWSLVDVDKENDNGYEKTGTYNGNKSFEKYNNQNKDGEISVLVANRFMLTANGSNVEMSVIKKALDAVNMQKLKSIK
jgi:hypothetical protein